MLPQLAACVVEVARDGVAGVFVDEHHTLGVQVTEAGLELALQHPDAAQFIAGVGRVGMTWLEQIGVFHLLVDTEGVRRNEHLALAVHGPLVALGAAVEQALGVDGRLAAGAGGGLVIAELGQLAHAASAGIVIPGQALVRAEVHGLDGQNHSAFFALGQDGEIRHIGVFAFVGLAQIFLGVITTELDIAGAAPGDIAACAHQCHVAFHLFGAGAAGHEVVPEQFQAGLGNGEGQSAHEALDSIAVVDYLGFQCIALDDGADVVVITEVAVARIDGNAHGGGELGE